MAAELTHLDETGSARMVDVSAKEVTSRSATASGVVRTTARVVALLHDGAMPKGDALGIARLAGIMAVKRTPDLIPLAHPIAVHGVEVSVTPEPLDAVGDEAGREDRAATILLTATVRTADRTGVEMEALTAVGVAGLALIDMIKAVDPAAGIDQIRVDAKDGGNTGRWRRVDHLRDRPAGGAQ